MQTKLCLDYVRKMVNSSSPEVFQARLIVLLKPIRCVSKKLSGVMAFAGEQRNNPAVCYGAYGVKLCGTASSGCQV